MQQHAVNFADLMDEAAKSPSDAETKWTEATGPSFRAVLGQPTVQVAFPPVVNHAGNMAQAPQALGHQPPNDQSQQMRPMALGDAQQQQAPGYGAAQAGMQQGVQQMAFMPGMAPGAQGMQGMQGMPMQGMQAQQQYMQMPMGAGMAGQQMGGMPMGMMGGDQQQQMMYMMMPPDGQQQMMMAPQGMQQGQQWQQSGGNDGDGHQGGYMMQQPMYQQQPQQSTRNGRHL